VAERIGAADAAVDTDHNPMVRSNFVDYHAGDSEKVKQHWSEFEKTRSIEALGTALHNEQDNFIHPSSWSWSGVVHTADWTFEETWRGTNQQLASKAAFQTYESLRTRVLAPLDLIRVPWDVIAPYVQRWISEVDQKQMDRYLATIRDVIDDYRRYVGRGVDGGQ
jgi:hypothetical protein